MAGMQIPSQSDNPFSADNEQGRLLDTDLAWLAGLIDGEGWVGLMRATRKSNGRLRYTAAVLIATTSLRIRDRLVDIYTRMGITFNVREIAPLVGSDGSPRKRKWNLGIQSNTQAGALVKMIRPYMVEKAVQADLLVDYVEWREVLPHRSTIEQPLFVAIQEKAEEIMQLMSDDRHRVEPSTTTRLALAA